MTRGTRLGSVVLVISSVASQAAPARADPQWNTSVVAGAVGLGDRSSFWRTTDFYGAVHGDLLFGRSSATDVGIGPSLEVGTAGFADFRLLGGPTLLLPLNDLLVVAATPAGYLRTDPTANFGVSGRIFAGVRGYNYDSGYSMSAGLLVGFDRDLTGQKVHSTVVAAEVDALVLVLPFLLLYEWARGPNS